MRNFAPPSSEASPPPHNKLSHIGFVLRYMWRYPLQLVAAGLALAVAAGATLAIPRGFQMMIDRGFGAASADSITPYFLGMLILSLVLAVATALRFYFVSWLGERVVADIRLAVFEHLLTLDPPYFDEHRPSEVASRLTADTAIVDQIVGTSISIALRNVVIGVGGLIYLFAMAPKLTGLLLLVIPCIIVPLTLVGRRLRVLSRTSQDRIADVGTRVSEVLGAIRIVQAFTQECAEAIRFRQVVTDGFDVARRRIRLRAVMTSLVIALVFGGIVLVLWEGARDVIAGRMTGGEITAFVLTSAIVAGAFGALTEVYGDIMRCAGAASRLGEFLASKTKITVPLHPTPLPETVRAALSFESVRFSYPSNPNVGAVADFGLQVTPGETVAVVGPSGAGKSTLFQLIQRFYDPQEGRILFDGIPLPDMDPHMLRRHIAFVPQDSVVFAASARENILYGRTDATLDDVWAAAEAANAATFLRELPDQIESFLGEGGARLSGGQRQRIAIARAILRNAPLLLLDEATSALDTESEQAVQVALDRLMQGRTTLVIAHRLSTVRNADRIVVMDRGRIVETGRHDDLIGADGLYARLARVQFEDHDKRNTISR